MSEIRRQIISEFEHIPFEPAAGTDIRLVTLPQLARLGSWQLELPHDRPEHLLIWITRGQGIALFDGGRAGIGVHNALFLPARSLMALDMGRQCFGQALVIPEPVGLTLPSRPIHLRLRNAAAQQDLAATLEALGREETAGQPLSKAAIRAYTDLAAIWLHRNWDPLAEPQATAARRLSRALFARLPGTFAGGGSMADHAAALGVTPTHLTRICKAQTGQTAAALLTGRILHAARSLLVQTNVPARDIAAHLGFGSAAYFTRFLQQHTGKTPTALRRRNG